MRLTVLTTVALVAFALPATANILRSCSADIRVFQHDKETEQIARLTAHGPCDSKLYADRCRERARVELDECLDIVWDDHRFDGQLPSHCRDMTTNRRGARMEWEGIRVYEKPEEKPKSLFNEIVYVACCRQSPEASGVTVRVGGDIWGGPGCAKSIGGGQTQSSFTLVPQFGIDCSHWRKGLCSPP
jgi:hypothetical protein